MYELKYSVKSNHYLYKMKYNAITKDQDLDPDRIQDALEVEVSPDHVVEIEEIVDQDQDQDADQIPHIKEKEDRIAVMMNNTSAVRRIIHFILIYVRIIMLLPLKQKGE